MWVRLAEIFADKSRWIAVICLCSVVVPAYWLRNAHIDNSIEVWTGTRSEAHQTYRQFLEKYGNEEFIVVAGEVQDPLSADALALQGNLASRLRQIEQVDGVLDITQAAAAFEKYGPEDWKDLLGHNGFFRNLLLGQDGHTFGVVAWLRRIDNPPERKIVVEQIESAVAELVGDTMQVHLAGTPLLNVALDRGSQEASRRILPAALAVSVIILGVVLRRLAGVLAVMCAVGATTLWTIGLMVLAGRTFNMVTITLPSLLTVLSLSAGIHMVLHIQLLLGDLGDRQAAVRRTVREVIPAIFLSNLTTAIGFGSLMVSDMQPVVDFGLFAATGMMLSFLFNAAVVPGILSWLRVGSISVPARPTHWTAPLGRIVASRRTWFLASAVVVLAVSLLLMTGLRVESNVLKFFPADSGISRDYEFIAERLTGLYTIELDAVTESQNGSTLLKQIERLGTDLSARPEVAQVIHYKTIATALDPIRRSALVDMAGASENPLKFLARKYRHTDGGRISLRMSILVRAMSGTDFYALMDFTERQAAQWLSPPAAYTLTGVVPLLNSAQNSLIMTQVRSFAAAAITVLILIGVFFASVRVFLAASLPNLLPTAVLFAAMAVLDIPLDAATVMIAGVAIGIAVDDTFHFFSCYREARLSGQDSPTAIHSSFQVAGRAILFTSLVATAGFVILLLAEFKPIQYFGLLAGVTMITASAADFLVLPACVAFVNLWDRQGQKT
ncbi:MAG: MMPL family transporter [Phycisphaerales bacterium]